MVEAEENVELEGKAWSEWREDLEKTSQTVPITSNFMKLPMEEMPTFGRFPALDNFTLVKCEECGRNVKINAFKSHMDKSHRAKLNEQRHQTSDLERLPEEYKESRSRNDLDLDFNRIEKWRCSRVLRIPLKLLNSRKAYRIYS